MLDHINYHCRKLNDLGYELFIGDMMNDEIYFVRVRKDEVIVTTTLLKHDVFNQDHLGVYLRRIVDQVDIKWKENRGLIPHFE